MSRHINELGIFRRASDMRKQQFKKDPKPGKGPKPGRGEKPPVGPPPWPPLDLPPPPVTGWNIGADESPN